MCVGQIYVDDVFKAPIQQQKSQKNFCSPSFISKVKYYLRPLSGKHEKFVQHKALAAQYFTVTLRRLAVTCCCEFYVFIKSQRKISSKALFRETCSESVCTPHSSSTTYSTLKMEAQSQRSF